VRDESGMGFFFFSFVCGIRVCRRQKKKKASMPDPRLFLLSNAAGAKQNEKIEKNQKPL